MMNTRVPNRVRGRTGAAALTGDSGELLDGQRLFSAALPLTSGVVVTVTSVILTPGDYDVWAPVVFDPAPTTRISLLLCGLSTVDGVAAGVDTGQNYEEQYPLQTPGGALLYRQTPLVPFNVSVNTEIFVVATGLFDTAALTVAARVWARRW